MKIGEFAKKTNVTTKMLRHYDEINLIKPSCVDNFTGYRLYDEIQTNYIHWINILKNLHFSLKEIKIILNGEMENSDIIKELKKKRIEIATGLNVQIQRKVQIDTLITILEKEGFSIDKEMNMMDLSQLNLHEIKKNMPNMELFLEQALALQENAVDKDLIILRLDISKFKSVNDDFGYEVGDAVIVAFYRTFKSNIEKVVEHYAIARSHGDEFVCCFLGNADVGERISMGTFSDVENFDFSAIGCNRQMKCYIGGVVANGDSSLLRNKIHETMEALELSRKKGPNTFTINNLDS